MHNDSLDTCILVLKLHMMHLSAPSSRNGLLNVLRNAHTTDLALFFVHSWTRPAILMILFVSWIAKHSLILRRNACEGDSLFAWGRLEWWKFIIVHYSFQGNNAMSPFCLPIRDAGEGSFSGCSLKDCLYSASFVVPGIKRVGFYRGDHLGAYRCCTVCNSWVYECIQRMPE